MKVDLAESDAEILSPVSSTDDPPLIDPANPVIEWEPVTTRFLGAHSTRARYSLAVDSGALKMLSTVLFLIAGVVNLLPLSGVFSAKRLQALYGVLLEDPNLVILMRHRAVLFGIVGSLLVGAAFQTPLRPVALTAGLVSMLSFVLIASLVGESNAELRRVVLADLVASALLVGAGLASYMAHAR